MNRKSLWIILLALGVTYVAGCGSSSNNNGNNILVSFSQVPAGILAPAATAQVTATVISDPKNAGVTWSCTPVGSCGSFNPTTTPSGTATTYTAPGTGSVAIIATSVTNTAQFASVNVNISNSAGIAGNYAFYLSGFDGSNIYSVAGAVAIAANGSLTGEQDYNDASGFTFTDVPVTSGSLFVNPATGQGSLTLITGNANLGISGTETLALNLVNSNHALIIQADGSATSSGSFDLQTLPSTPNGGFSFVLSGAGNTGNSDFFGGVFTVAGSNVSNGMFDENQAGNVSFGQTFNTATLSSADALGRGTLTGTGIATTIVYYIVGPEVMRLMQVDSSRTLVGSAFGQGASTGNFNNSSVGDSVFSVQSNFAGNIYAAVGQIVPVGGNFSGVADVNEEEVGFADAQIISGTYSIASNGYGSLTITSGTLGDVSVLGIYATDPTLNLNDPNNTASGGGGAAVVDLDGNVAGSGVLVPQTDITTASFDGPYALGFQDFVNNGATSGQFDFVGNATATASSLSGSGVVSDPGEILAPQTVDPGTTFTSTTTPDSANPGRYLLDPFTMIVGDGAATLNFQAVIYQASGEQLFWLENGADDNASVFGGQIQQQTLPLPLAVKAAAKKAQKQ
jgi:hypothetical protein